MSGQIIVVAGRALDRTKARATRESEKIGFRLRNEIHMAAGVASTPDGQEVDANAMCLELFGCELTELHWRFAYALREHLYRLARAQAQNCGVGA